MTSRISLAGLWGVVGVVALLMQAIVRLAPRALEPFEGGALGGVHVAVLIGWVAFAAYAEGYRAFQKQFTPRVVARAQHLSARQRPLHAMLAPAFCMGLFHATRKRMIVSWSVSLGVVGLILAVKQLPQPWRGIIDLGVVVALGWGVVMLVHFTLRAVAGHRMPVSADIPT